MENGSMISKQLKIFFTLAQFQIWQSLTNKSKIFLNNV